MKRIPLARLIAQAVAERLKWGWVGEEHGCQLEGRECDARSGCGSEDGFGTGKGDDVVIEEL